jgi:hypothetical protein
MHDWSFVSLFMEWSLGKATITLKDNNSVDVFLVADGLVDLKVPKQEEWGKSISVNEINGPTVLTNGNCYIAIEIQSGDKIEIEAKSIKLPNNN